MPPLNSFSARGPLRVAGRTYEIYRLSALSGTDAEFSRLPYSFRILLENLLRHEDGASVTADDVLTLARWSPAAPPTREIAFTPARVLMQDFTGIPAIVDLAAMRDAMAALGGDPGRINPAQPVELVIDHSMQVDFYGTPDALERNREIDYARNRERYAFLRWGQRAFDNFRVVPPYTGICHQVNLEYLARVVFSSEDGRTPPLAYPDTLVGTDSHTPMVNGLGVLGWGVGGIEAEAAMLGQQVSMLIPQVLGVRLQGELREVATATDLVLTVAELLRKKGVVGKFVEFYGPGMANVPLADRATIGNMSPEYGATCAIFPVDEETLRYLRFTGRSKERVALVEAYMKEQGLFHTPESPEPEFSDTLVLDLTTVEPSIAGPRRPQDRVPLSRAKSAFLESLGTVAPTGGLSHGAVVIASITSCTNTSNPSVMIAAGLLARKAVEHGLRSKPWVKTSLAPGSKVVTEYLAKAGLTQYLDQLGFHNVGYGCGTCIGNSGPLPATVSEAIARHNLVVCSALSGNRNFEGRVHSEVRANYLMSPPLVVAYALAGRMDWDPYAEPLGIDGQGKPMFLRDIWPTQQEVRRTIEESVESEMFRRTYAEVFAGDEVWQSLEVPGGDLFEWDPASTYVRHPPYFEGMSRRPPEAVLEIVGARVLALLGDSVTTDHISPAGAIKVASPAGRYLMDHGVKPADFNSYGARRGNHEVMVRGTFANPRIRNGLVPGTEGSVTCHLLTREVMPVYDAAVRYEAAGTQLIVLAGKEYGSGSSRDWSAKGPALQGVRAVIAESFERIHRSNLVGMGILPLQFAEGDSVKSLGLTGRESFDVVGLSEAFSHGLAAATGRELTVRARRTDGSAVEFRAVARIDTPQEVLYYLQGGILPYVLRNLLNRREESVPGAMAAGAQIAAGAIPRPGVVEEGSMESFPASDPPTY